MSDEGLNTSFARPSPPKRALSIRSPSVRSLSIFQKGKTLTNTDISDVWAFLNPQGKQELTLEAIRSRLAVFYEKPEKVPIADIKALMGKKKTLSFHDLNSIMNAVNDQRVSDPVKQAFQLYDPNGTGNIDIVYLKKLIVQLGYLDFTDEDMKDLVASLDIDGDGKIGLQDFRSMLQS